MSNTLLTVSPLSEDDRTLSVWYKSPLYTLRLCQFILSLDQYYNLSISGYINFVYLHILVYIDVHVHILVYTCLCIYTFDCIYLCITLC